MDFVITILAKHLRKTANAWRMFLIWLLCLKKLEKPIHLASSRPDYGEYFNFYTQGSQSTLICAACRVAPELNELLDGEDTSQVLDRSAVLSMASLELCCQPLGRGRSIRCGQRRSHCC